MTVWCRRVDQTLNEIKMGGLAVEVGLVGAKEIAQEFELFFSVRLKNVFDILCI
jgi:hypothetical protein